MTSLRLHARVRPMGDFPGLYGYPSFLSCCVPKWKCLSIYPVFQLEFHIVSKLIL